MIYLKTILIDTNVSTEKMVLAQVANAIAKDMAEKIANKLHEAKCKHHPEHDNFIYLIANESAIPKLEKKNFCCPEFSEKISISISEYQP